MKNKKLFAILTLVCFMFTLMPVAAFAYNEEVSVVLSGAGKTDESTLTVSAGQEVTPSLDGTPDNGSGDLFFAVAADGTLEATTTSAFYIKTPGTYEIYAMDNGAAGTIDGKVVLKADKLDAYLEDDTLVAEYAVLKVKAVDVDYVIDIKAPATYDSATDKYAVSIPANGAYGAVELTADLSVSGSGKAVKDAELTFKNNGLTVVKVDPVTERNGEMKFKVSGTIVGTYEVEVSYKDAKAVIVVSVGNVGPAGVTTVAEPTNPVDINEDSEKFGIGFNLVDANGNVIKNPSAIAETVYDENGVASTVKLYQIAVVDQPADSDIDGDDLSLKWDTQNNYWVIDGINVNSNLEEGTYKFVVSLENGASASASVKVKEFDKAVAIKLVYPATAGLGDNNVAPLSIKEVDANGVTRTLTAGSTGLKLAANGAAVEDFTAGVVTVKGEEKYLGSVITVVAVYNDELIASADITVIEDAVELKYVPAGKLEVAKNNTLIMNVVNANGEKIAVNADADLTAADVKVIVLDKPEGAYVAASALQVKQNNAVYVSFTPSAAGEYKLHVYATYEEDGNARYISGIAEVTVGATEGQFNDVVVISIGADKMIVNNETVALDVAPYIENNRTMMQYNVLGAFGFDIQWVQETRSVVAEGNGIKVVMNIDSKVATVNGEEVTLDVAPTIVNGRTVVPVGFLTGTFGINPTFIYGETGLDSILFAK